MGTETGAIIIAGPATESDRAFTKLRSAGLPLGFAAIVLAGWQLAVTLGHIPPVILPSPLSIARYIFDRYDILLMHAVPTTLESAAGFAIRDLARDCAGDRPHLFRDRARGALPQPGFLPVDRKDRACSFLHHLARNWIAVAYRLCRFHRVFPGRDIHRRGFCQRR
jgi:hypothetical protein